MEGSKKINIYQVMTRLFGNKNTNGKINGTIEDNGVGKFSDFTQLALKKIKELGITHIWYTGIIEHATLTDYSQYGIPSDYAEIIKGRAGSPYAIKDYFDVHPDLADNVPERMNEFLDLIQRTHQTGMKAIIDFVPNHFARNYQSDSTPEGFEEFGINDNSFLEFSPANDFYYIPGKSLVLPQKALEDAAKMQNKEKHGYYSENPAKVTGNDVFSYHPSYTDWYETVKLNYGIDIKNGGQKHFDPLPSVWKKMHQVLQFWALKGVDGFRVDMAEMVPIEFWSWVIPQIKSEFRDLIFIAEIYKPYEYRDFIHSGFDFLYDKKGFYETVRHVLEGKTSAESITSIWQRLNGMDDHMLRFLENHDEERIASDFFLVDPLKAIPGILLAATMHRGPFMLYFGQEVGEAARGASGFSGDDSKTSIFDYWHVPEHQKWMNNGKFDGGNLSELKKILREQYVKILNLSLEEDAFRNGNFYDLMWANQHFGQQIQKEIYAFLRHTDPQKILVVLNFDPTAETVVMLKIPKHAIDLLKIDKNKSLTLTELFPGNQQKLIAAEKLMTDGIEILILPSSGVVYEIK